MPTKEITALRKSGKLDEALEMALAELNNQPEDIWAKRNIAWVYFEFAKQNLLPEQFDAFSSYISKIVQLKMPEDEKMLFDSAAWQIIKIGYALLKLENVEIEKIDILFSYVKGFHLTKPSDVYSVLFNLFHKIYKDNAVKYLELADWWNFENFRKEDYEKETLPSGKTVMSIVEQAYIAYARHLLPRQLPNGETSFDREKASTFLPMLDKIEDTRPDYQYPSYYKAKLLLALGEKDNILSSLLPFAKKKQNDFWVWDVLSEAFPDDEEKKLACYCRGLLCFSPEEMLVNLRAKIIPHFLKREMWNEAKTEILKIVDTRNRNNWKIPSNINEWIHQSWFVSATENQNNKRAYRQFSSLTEEILFHDIPEETVIVTFVNSDKKILNFIASEKKFGFFKYDRFLKTVCIGDTLKVRFLKKDANGCYQVASVKIFDDLDLKTVYLKEFRGIVGIREGQNFGLVNGVYLPPVICEKNRLTNGCTVSGNAIKTYDEKRKRWDWKAYEIQKEQTGKKLFIKKKKNMENYDKYLTFFLNHIDFAKQYLSIHYPFNYQYLIDNWSFIEHGNAFYCVFLSDTDWVYPSTFGLSYNKNIEWNSELKAKYEYGFDNPFIGYVEGTGESPVEFDEKNNLYSIIPLDKKKEIESRNNASISHWSSVVAPYLDFDDKENFEGPNTLDVKSIFTHFDHLQFDEFKKIFDESKITALLNESIWENTLKDEIDDKFCNIILNEIKKQVMG